MIWLWFTLQKNMHFNKKKLKPFVCLKRLPMIWIKNQFYSKDSGAPLIMEGRNFFEVIGILADVKEDNGINPGVFAYEVHPDNFEFIYGKKSKKS